MLGNSIQLASKFSHKAAQTLAEFSMTMNMATAAVAKADADIQNTGGQHVVIAGEHDATLAQDAGLDISADTVLGIWVTATAYTAAASVQYVEDGNGNKQWYACIADHTSSAATKPGQPDHVNSSWRTYWTESSNRAEQASGDIVLDNYSRYYLVLARKTTGVMTTVLAGDIALDADVELTIPQFDPELFVAIAVILKDSTTALKTWGTSDDSGIVTITQLIGPVFPTGLGIDPN
jgi:hypothetical protein